ncbi:MAG TPA: dihydrofolate reductase family protein [Aliidongia sp.]|uniref:dihydrofolate reductase family protein n=1 Tax=Aliidongia sp. TaxID=1914230 RepID=UPI002DDC9791|nr:dihydrofolate reductase family protein [Aliidongia sp.]HEV2678711.1 dihydrofolate reductase family protein [Aliidongia sp.]
MYAETTTSAKQQSLKMLRQYQLGTITYCHSSANMSVEWRRLSSPSLGKAAAGDRNDLVHGAYTAQRVLEAGVLDELKIHQIPVLFGAGRRLFDGLPSRVELEIVRVIDTPEATHIRYRVRR